MKIDLNLIQCLVAEVPRGYAHSRHHLFHAEDASDGKRFLRAVRSVVVSAIQHQQLPDRLINLAISAAGLRHLGVPSTLLAKFESSFIDEAGPDADALGDARKSRSDPVNWWEGQFSTGDIDFVVHLHAQSEHALASASQQVREYANEARIHELIPREDHTTLDGRSLGGRKLHFGYMDGFSQPNVYWDDEAASPEGVDFRHFILGYATPTVTSFPRQGPAADLVRNSSYEVFRWVYQDVAVFNEFLRTEGPRVAPELPPDQAEEWLAARLMGRWRDGTPLVLSPDSANHALADKSFSYAVDPQGFRCPFSAHVRVVNPRDQPLDPVVVEPVPHVIRRGMPYGPELASDADDGIDRGVIGIFICADISRQFYTLTRWIKRNSFSPVYDQNRRVQDALCGNRQVFDCDTTFRIPRVGGDIVVNGLPDFIHTKGTVFLLLPSLDTLDRLAH